MAAHITAAAENGPRYDGSLTAEERKSADNGIWMCLRCGQLVDKDEEQFPSDLLRRWKVDAEKRAESRLTVPAARSTSDARQELAGPILAAVNDQLRVVAQWRFNLEHYPLALAPHLDRQILLRSLVDRLEAAPKVSTVLYESLRQAQTELHQFQATMLDVHEWHKRDAALYRGENRADSYREALQSGFEMLRLADEYLRSARTELQTYLSR